MWGGEKDRQSWSFREFLLRPPGKVFLIGLVVFALFTLWIDSVPIVGFPWSPLVPALWLIVALL